MSKKKQPGAVPEEAPQKEMTAPEETEKTEVPGNEATEQPVQTEAAAEPEAEAAEVQSESPPTEEEVLARQLDEARWELTDCKDRYLRLAAEYDNFRKRTRAERDNLYTTAAADTAEKFLPVYDNLERALKQQTQDAAFYKGVEMIQTGLLGVFEKLNIRPIEVQGQPFDPNLHDAAMHIEDDSGEENTVAEVFQTGFIMGEKVIRPAVVKVKN